MQHSKIEITEVSELIEIAQNLPSDDYVGGWFYRGQSDISWTLEPKAHREPYSGGDRFEFKFKMWLKQSHNYPEMQFSNELEAMAIAQHHGFASKLLDWSSNILTAAFFACCDDFDADAHLFAYFPLQYIYLDDDVMAPKDIERVVAYQPKNLTTRLKAQSGCFTYHKENEFTIDNEFFEPLEIETLRSWIIPAERKPHLLRLFDRLAINKWGQSKNTVVYCAGFPLFK